MDNHPAPFSLSRVHGPGKRARWPTPGVVGSTWVRRRSRSRCAPRAVPFPSFAGNPPSPDAFARCLRLGLPLPRPPTTYRGDTVIRAGTVPSTHSVNLHEAPRRLAVRVVAHPLDNLQPAAGDGAVGGEGVVDGDDGVGSPQTMRVGTSSARWRRLLALTAWPPRSMTGNRLENGVLPNPAGRG